MLKNQVSVALLVTVIVKLPRLPENGALPVMFQPVQRYCVTMPLVTMGALSPRGVKTVPSTKTFGPGPGTLAPKGDTTVSV